VGSHYKTSRPVRSRCKIQRTVGSHQPAMTITFWGNMTEKPTIATMTTFLAINTTNIQHQWSWFRWSIPPTTNNNHISHDQSNQQLTFDQWSIQPTTDIQHRVRIQQTIWRARCHKFAITPNDMKTKLNDIEIYRQLVDTLLWYPPWATNLVVAHIA